MASFGIKNVHSVSEDLRNKIPISLFFVCRNGTERGYTFDRIGTSRVLFIAFAIYYTIVVHTTQMMFKKSGWYKITAESVPHSDASVWKKGPIIVSFIKE